MNPWDRERDQLELDLMEGMITNHEYQKQMRDINRDEQYAAQDAAQDAYDREMDSRGFGPW